MTNEIARVTKVRPLDGRWLRVWFADGAIKDVNLEHRLRGRVFESIRHDRSIFEQVRVDHGTVVWPGSVDLDPDVLYGNFEPEAGPPYERREVRPPNASVS